MAADQDHSCDRMWGGPTEQGGPWRAAAWIVLPAVTTVVLCAFVMLRVALPAYRESLMDAKRAMISELTASVWQLLNDYERRVIDGELSRAEAMRRAKERVRILRYGVEAKDYFWINTAGDRAMIIMHPYQTELEGVDVTEMLDQREYPPFKEILRISREAGAGYVTYNWQWKDDPETIVPKVSHVRLFAPWNWVVGTGVYVEDVRAEIGTLSREMAYIFGGIGVLVVALTASLSWHSVRTDKRRRQAAARLRQSQQRLQMALEGGSLGTWDWNIQTGEVVFDERWARMLGYQLDELDPNVRSWERLVHPDELPEIRRVLDAHLDGETEAYEAEHRFKSKSGEWVWVLDKGRVIERDGAGRPLRACGTYMDITDRKNADAERETLQAQLRQAQKMEAVGQLAGGIAHDFNNLLQVILGYGEMVIADGESDPSTRASIEEILSAGSRAKTLVSQMLAFSRRQVLEMEDLALNDVIADLMKMLRRVIGEHITLHVLPGEQLGTVRADRGQIAQILTNLCVNACDAMDEGGVLAIETENVVVEQAYCDTHAWATPGRYVLLSVTDTGCGMDAETLGRIFEPFFTTKEVGKGTGLGLSTVYGLVKQHKGHVDVDSEPGKGTAFKIYLPIVERPASAVGDKIEDAAPVGTETILVAEDDQEVLGLSQNMLTQAGYVVLTAPDGVQAVRLFEQDPDAIDLAIVDVVMPELGGRAVYERMRAKRPELPVLFVSGYSANAVHTNFILDEGLTLLQKPFRGVDLLRMVREAIDRGK